METINRSANGVRASVDGFAVDNQLQADFGTGPLEHRVLAGVDYQHVSSSSGFWVNSNNIQPINAYHPVYGAQPLPDPFAGTPFVLSDSTLDQTGIYLQDQIKLGGWIATLGGRHDWADTAVDNKLTAPTSHQEIDDQKWTGSAGLSYLFDNGLAPYFNYSTSYLPASGTTLINGTTGGPLKPTTGEGYEAGVKYQPPGTKTLLTAAAFQITQQNVTTTTQTAGVPIVAQTGEVRVRGVELEGKTSLTENFDLITGYSYLQPIITSDPLNVGNDLQQVSRQTASAWGMYTWHEGSLRGLGLGAGVRYIGSQYAAADNKRKSAWLCIRRCRDDVRSEVNRTELGTARNSS